MICAYFYLSHLHRHEPRLPPAKGGQVARVHDGRPQQLDGEGPVGEAELGLLLVAHVTVGQDQGDGGSEAQRDALKLEGK